MRLFFISHLLLAAAFSRNLVGSSPVDKAEVEAPNELAKRIPSGQLKAWLTDAASCSGTPSFTWTNPGYNQCINFVDGSGNRVPVGRLQWTGNQCFLYVYDNFNCVNDFYHPEGTGICIRSAGVSPLTLSSYKLVC